MHIVCQYIYASVIHILFVFGRITEQIICILIQKYTFDAALLFVE